MQNYIHSGKTYDLLVIDTFFDVLKHHLSDGDLCPEEIDRVLRHKHAELLANYEE
jgi:hypothetical protein